MKLMPPPGLLHHSCRVLLNEVAHVHLAAELHRAKRHFAHDESRITNFLYFISFTPSSIRVIAISADILAPVRVDGVAAGASRLRVKSS